MIAFIMLPSGEHTLLTADKEFKTVEECQMFIPNARDQLPAFPKGTTVTITCVEQIKGPSI